MNRLDPASEAPKQVLHTLGQAGCKIGTIAVWWVVWHVDSIYDTVFQFFALLFCRLPYYLFGPGEIRCYPGP